MRSIHNTVLVAALLALGFGVFAYKVWTLGFPLERVTNEPSWNLEIHATAQTTADVPFLLRLNLPRSEGRFGIVNEGFVSADAGLSISENEFGERLASWTRREKGGEINLYYKAELFLFSNVLPGSFEDPDPKEFMAPDALISDLTEAEELAVEALYVDVKSRSADLDSFMRIGAITIADAIDDPDNILNIGRTSTALRTYFQARGLAFLARLHGRPARLVNGVDLSDPRRRMPIARWIEVWDGEHWRIFDGLSGEPGKPETYFPIWRGPDRLGTVRDGDRPRIVISVAQRAAPSVDHSVALGQMTGSPVAQISLYSFPVEMQQVYQILLMVPLGAIVLIFLRQFVGLKTFGTFMPVLIALSFRDTNLISGLIMFTLFVVLGLIFRLYFEKLRLLSIPRLSAVMIVVVILMMLSSFILEKFSLGSGLSLALFPIVILVMTIERMSVVWEEYGPGEASKQGVGSLIAAAIAFVVMNIPYMQFLMVTFPELLLVLLAIALMCGRYTGYKLTELYRFRNLVKSS